MCVFADIPSDRATAWPYEVRPNKDTALARAFLRTGSVAEPPFLRPQGGGCWLPGEAQGPAPPAGQIQALDHTQPGLPMKKGRAGTMTHDYKRHGTTTLFAALDVLEGRVIGQCMKRHRHQEFIRFLNVIDARVPRKETVHVIIDNYAAHKHPKVLEWLARHPRFVFHFTPTSASWLNAVEGLFATLTKRRLKRGVFRSVKDLKDAIHGFIADTNAKPRPFVWTKDPRCY
jgi:transposase